MAAETTRPPLSFWQIWNMAFGFLGIQFGWALQMANMSAIYEYLGADAHQIPMLWLAAPLTGLLVQPIIGHLSDRTWNRLGRRRPYFLTGALLASFALIAMPHSSALWMAAGLLWIMDASINISMEPFRAFVADLLPPEQRTRGYAMQALFIGLGAVIASMLPWLLYGLFPPGGDGAAIPLAVRLAFYIGAVAFLAAVLYSALIVSVIAHTVYYHLIQKYEATLISPLTLMTPLATIVMGVLITKDHFDLRMGVGAALALLGVLIVALRPNHVMPLLMAIRNRAQ